jgi:GNAT superfamily N-acetyltransferase
MIKELIKKIYPNLNKTNQIIFQIAHQYKFYPLDIISHLMASQNTDVVEAIPIEHPIPDNTNSNCSLILKENNTMIIGFLIIVKRFDGVEILYLFIIPECRGQGLATESIKYIKEQFKGIPIKIPTKEEKLISIINKLDFKFERLCNNKIDLLFTCKNNV